MKLYAFLKKLVQGFIKFLFRIEVQGEENIPKEGAVLVCPNHISNWDPIVLGVVFDRQIRFMAKASLFKIPLLNALIRTLGAFPVKRGAADPSAIKTAIKLLGEGDAVGMFPQGTRYIGTEPGNTEVKSGVGMVAHRANVDVLPVQIKTKNYRILPFRKVYIKIGDCIPNSELGIENGTRDEYTNASRYIFGKILDLATENSEEETLK
ncbi:MAG: 1-acyl-sn-glycerol-3-phosphate acyltransferase [Ruminococcaceae bacterium]|nr:1-acyl-sn-glycerol-3-phosphate acyltransferase [Oscillospiraceae bacterium]